MQCFRPRGQSASRQCTCTPRRRASPPDRPFFCPSRYWPSEKNSVAAFGDTRAQTASTLTAIEAALKRRNLSLRDVVKMTVFLVGDPAKGGRMDFAGLREAYREQFGTAAQPNLPTRSAVQVAALANPGWLVEIEVTAVRP